MKIENLRELYVRELQDLYDAENQIIKALPKMIRAASTGSLSTALEDHLETTRSQAVQIEELIAQFDEKPNGRKCKGMEALLKECEEVLKEDMDPEVKDAAIISAAQRVEHYEIAAYGSVRTYTGLLGDEQAESVLDNILEQEKAADIRLTNIAEEINIEAAASHQAIDRDSSRRQSSSRPGRARAASTRSQASARDDASLDRDPREPGSHQDV